MQPTCTNCDDALTSTHQDEHPGRCCDCADLAFGASLEKINAERAARGAKPIARKP